MLDAAIVGLGRWGQNLVDAVQGKSDRLRFVRAVVRNPASCAEYAAARGLAVGTDLAAALADPAVQAVVLATPHSLHAAQIVAAAAAGKPVFCEKPLALTRADAARATAACARAGVALAVGHDKRFWPSMRELARIVAAGELGELLHVEGHNSNETSRVFTAWRAAPAESPGGGMTGAGIHMLDAFVGLLGSVARVQAQLVTRQTAPEALDTVSVLLEFANGVSGTLATVRATPSYWRAHVFGHKGSAEAIGATELVIRRSGAAPQRLSFDAVPALRAELEAFADAATGRAPYPVTPAQMVDTTAAFEAIVQSIASGVGVTVAR